jgi:hypothetical protein
VSNPCLADIAALVRLAGPDDAPNSPDGDELIPRASVVEAAMRLKSSTDALARERDAAQVELSKALARCARLDSDVDTARKGRSAWEGLYNERNKLWRRATDQLDVVRALLEENGCDCDCDHGGEEHEDSCERCLACRIAAAVERKAGAA